MSFKRTLTTAALAAAVAAGSIMPLAGAANAAGWKHRGGGHGDHSMHRLHKSDSHRHYGHRHHRRHDHTGRNVAIGAFATILGLAIASEARRSYYDDGY